MVHVRILDGTVRFEVVGLHKLWALRAHVDVAAGRITAVRADPYVSLGWSRSLRFPGTHLPGRIKAGTYYERGRKVFWDVVRPAGAIVVELRGARFDELVVEVPDPEDAVRQLREAARRAAS